MKDTFRKIFENNYPGFEYIRDNLIQLIWKDILKPNIEIDSNIETISKITIFANQGSEINFVDVELTEEVALKKNRQNIKNFIISNVIASFSSAIIFFHYKNNPSEWRISYIFKGRTNTDTTVPTRYSYLCGLNHACKTVAERFDVLQKKDFINNIDVQQAFSVGSISDDFFREYKVFYEDFVQYITGNRYLKKGSKWEKTSIHPENEIIFKQFYKIAEKECDSDDNNKITELAQKYVRDYIKKFLGRLTFLQFLQKKGWLGVPINASWGAGDKNYLQNLFDNSSLKENFLSKVLNPLFFDTLNKQRINDQILPILGENLKIPYLNGGLFEKDPLFNDINIDFPKEFFRNKEYSEFERKFLGVSKSYNYKESSGLLDFFSKYNFTIDETDPDDQEIGVEPEMLGKIFENLLEDNKDKGAFYTPKEIVKYMCKESLITYLQTNSKIPNYKIRNFVINHNLDFNESEKVYLLNKLKNIKVCDPAVGSGAFPMGMMNELYYCQVLLLGDDSNPAQIKKDIVRENIYGVDIEKGAVDIARLRFWLAIIVDEKNPIPLPNLDFKIMQGNSLLESYDNIDLSHLIEEEKESGKGKNILGEWEDSRDAFIIQKNHDIELFKEDLNCYFGTSNHDDKYNIQNKILNFIQQQIINNLKITRADLENEARNIDSQAALVKRQLENMDNIKNTNDYNIKEKKLNKYLLKKDKILAKINNIDKKCDKVISLALNNTNFFLWHTWFQDVFSRENDQKGFDIVIGNPPYLEARNSSFSDSLKNAIQNTLEKNYSPEEVKYFPRGADLLIFFYELSFRLLNSNGVNTFITENAWLSTDYGKLFQEYLLKYINIQGIIDSDFKYFETADINTVITIFKKKTSPSDYVNFFHCSENLETVNCNTIDKSLNPTTIKMVSFEKDNKLLKKYKWGLLTNLDSTMMPILQMLDELNDKSLESKISIGQGLNLTKNDIYNENGPNRCPIFMNPDGPRYNWTSPLYFVDKKSINKNRQVPLLILPRGIGTHFCCFNDINGYSSSYVEIYEDTPLNETEKLQIWLFCNSSLLWLFREYSGRCNLGGGMLKAEATDLKLLPICFKFKDIDKIKLIYEKAKNELVPQNIEEAVHSKIHREIDKIVFDFFDINDKSEHIINSLVDRFNWRLKKSKSK